MANRRDSERGSRSIFTLLIECCACSRSSTTFPKYAQWRPTPLFRARRLENVLNTPAKIYYKYEGVSPAGSHKPNTVVAQAYYYNKKEGTKRLATETGAGQWGSSLAMACSFYELECQVYMVRVSYDQKPYRRALMEAFGASVLASPSMTRSRAAPF